MKEESLIELGYEIEKIEKLILIIKAATVMEEIGRLISSFSDDELEKFQSIIYNTESIVEEEICERIDI